MKSNTSYNQDRKILSWAEEDRPREKLELRGHAALTDAELIAILIHSGTVELTAVDVGKQLMQAAEHNLGILSRFSIADFMKIKGIGKAKAITIMAALELGRRRKNTEALKRPTITSSQEVYQEMIPHLMDKTIEEFWIVLLNRANKVIKKVQISKGGVSGTVVDPKVIFKEAIEQTASALILVHNHPSGNLKPSQEDMSVTQKLKEAGRLLDIPVLDHIIIADQAYMSFRDEGYI